MVLNGDLGDLRVVLLSLPVDSWRIHLIQNNPRVKWRFTAKHAGMAAITIDCGIHALNMACFVTNKKIVKFLLIFFSGIRAERIGG